MFGIVGMIMYGIAYTIGWSKDEQMEQHERKSSKEKGLSFYYDKKGRQRWTTTKKKRTAQEIYQEKINDANKRDSETKKQIELLRKKHLQQIINDTRKNYELFVIHKDRISFDEYLGTSLPSKIYEEYEELNIIRKNIPEEKKKKIRENPVYYG